MPTLLLLTGPRANARWPVLGDRFSIGRESGCDAVITDAVAGASAARAESISRRHALMTFVDGEWYIEDGDGRGRKSRNGTSVNDQKVPFPTRRRLQGSDRIRICDVWFRFLADDDSSFSAEAFVGHQDSGPCLDEQPADRLRSLPDISAALRGALDPDAVLERTLEHLFKLFPQAERGLVVFRESPNGPIAAPTIRTPRGEPADQGFSTSVVRRCLESVEAVLGNDLSSQFPESESIGVLPVRSLVCAPLWTPDGRAIGAVQLDTHADGQKFTTDDMRLLLGVASQTSIALSGARMDRERLALQRRADAIASAQRVAREVQLALLPQKLPTVPGYTFFAHYEAAQEVGGDCYDFVPLSGGRLAVLLGDVSGKGVAAALVMAKFGVEARVCLETATDPAAAVSRLNQLMQCAAVAEKFVTLAVAVLDPVAHVVTLVNAGHPSPLLVRAAGAVDDVAPLEVSGPPIGIVPQYTYQFQNVRLEPGDQVVLYSDGVSDARNASEQCFGTDAIRTTLEVAGEPGATGEYLVQSVRTHSAGCEQADDITVVCFGRAAPRPK